MKEIQKIKQGKRISSSSPRQDPQSYLKCHLKGSLKKTKYVASIFDLLYPWNLSLPEKTHQRQNKFGVNPRKIFNLQG